MTRRIPALLLLAAIFAAKAFAWDRILAHRRSGRPREPLRMLVVVEAPIEETWRVIADIGLQPAWMHEMKSVTLTTAGPTRVGTRGEATVRIFGISVTDPVEVVAFDAPTRFEIRHEGLFTGGGVITLEAGAGNTTTIVRWAETLVPPLLPELGALVQAPILREIFQADLHRLARLVESGAVE
ncbi:MAG TPA: SRPBCC family protein [Candidatus Limnocylindrales bacterium]|nr:SRPBCC family protein [Candidatus Limnocylindrales bacterium]